MASIADGLHPGKNSHTYYISVIKDTDVSWRGVASTIVVSVMYAHEVFLLFLRQSGISLDSVAFMILFVLEPIHSEPEKTE